jgi:hypothetical protein
MLFGREMDNTGVLSSKRRQQVLAPIMSSVNGESLKPRTRESMIWVTGNQEFLFASAVGWQRFNVVDWSKTHEGEQQDIIGDQS